jgi:hypothetical protein
MIMTLELEYIHNIIGLCQSLLDVQIVARKKEKKEGRKEGRKKERKNPLAIKFHLSRVE